MLPLSVVAVTVSHHAQWRAAERFGICFAEVLIEEVQDAFREGRVSDKRPPGVRGGNQTDRLYAWTPEMDRVYVLGLNQLDGGESFMVATVSKPDA